MGGVARCASADGALHVMLLRPYILLPQCHGPVVYYLRRRHRTQFELDDELTARLADACPQLEVPLHRPSAPSAQMPSYGRVRAS